MRGMRMVITAWAVLLMGCSGGSSSNPDAATDRGLQDGLPGFSDGTLPGDTGGPTPETGPKLDSVQPPQVVPPLGGSSNGSGGAPAPSGKVVTAAGVSFMLIVPSSYQAAVPGP